MSYAEAIQPVTMNAHLFLRGDKDACIPDDHWTIDTRVDKQLIEDGTVDRERVKDLVRECYTGLLQEQVHVHLDDECATCGELLPAAGGPDYVRGCPESWHRESTEGEERANE